MGLRPAEFWAMTPYEFGVLCAPEPDDSKPSDDDLRALADRFPDRMK